MKNKKISKKVVRKEKFFRWEKKLEEKNALTYMMTQNLTFDSIEDKLLMDIKSRKTTSMLSFEHKL